MNLLSVAPAAGAVGVIEFSAASAVGAGFPGIRSPLLLLDGATAGPASIIFAMVAFALSAPLPDDKTKAVSDMKFLRRSGTGTPLPGSRSPFTSQQSPRRIHAGGKHTIQLGREGKIGDCYRND